jgi:hypothetical protein
VGANNFGGWSNETTRGDLMADMIALAFACDLTRAVSWMLTFDQCFMSSRDAAGPTEDMHYLSHNGTAQNLADNANWHAARFARLIGKLATLTDGAGQPLIDSTFLALLFAEGENAHNSLHMTYLTAGCRSQLKLGQHLDAGGQHPAKILISGMQAIGLTRTTLGEISGPLASLMV